MNGISPMVETAHANGPRPEVLSSANIARLSLRLAAELRAFFESVPAPSASARALSTFLNVDRNTCQKSLAASRLNNHQVLIVAPGPKSLEQLIQAAEHLGLSPAVVGGVRSAVAEFRDAIERSGGTHRSLKAVIARLQGSEAHNQSDSNPDITGIRAEPASAAGERQRRGHFSMSADTLGLRVEATITASIISVVPRATGPCLTLTGVRAHVGCSGRPGGMPLSVSVFRLNDGQLPGAHSITSRVLEAFSSPSLPVITQRRPTNASVDVIDVSHPSAGGQPVDVVVQTRFPPSASSTPIDEQVLATVSVMRQPTARLIADVFVERPLAAGRLPIAGAYLWNVPLDREESVNNWFDTLPGTLKIEVLGTGLGAVDDAVWPRHREMYSHVFANEGLDPSRYIGYRLDVRFPMTGAQYRLALDKPVLAE